VGDLFDAGVGGEWRELARLIGLGPLAFRGIALRRIGGKDGRDRQRGGGQGGEKPGGKLCLGAHRTSGDMRVSDVLHEPRTARDRNSAVRVGGSR